jgi:isoleucyl-tRNA synthetase
LAVSRAGRALEQFVIEDLSNWYVRRTRDRFWAPGFEPDKRAAYETLYECLEVTARLLAPFAPFLSERVWLGLAAVSGAGESVHLADWPTADGSAADEDLERRMDTARRVVRLGRAARNRASLKTRQPLRRVRIVPATGGVALDEQLASIVLDELNVKAAESLDAGSVITELRAKAKFDVLGPRFGKGMKSVAAAIAALPTEAVAALERTGEATVEVGDVRHMIRRDEVTIEHEDPEGWVLEREAGWSVALDQEIDEELRAEGFAREIVNKVQFMRKRAGFEVTDRIEIFLEGTESLQAAVERHADLIRRETQADRIGTGDVAGEAREQWKINGEPAVLSLKRV